MVYVTSVYVKAWFRKNFTTHVMKTYNSERKYLH